MILHYTVLLVAAFITPSWAGMDSTEFENFIENRCFRVNEHGLPLINGQENPLASTLENFIALVEKFEQANPLKGLREELFFFIRNFTYTNIEYNTLGDIVRWTPKDANYADIDGMWEPDETLRRLIPDVEDPFTDAEKCSLYFMISHSIVRKNRKISEQRAPPVMQNSTKNRKWGSDIAYNDEDNHPLEQGVVAIRGTNEAVSLGRVLTGMYVGLNQGRRRDLSTFSRIPKELIPQQGNVVDPLYTLTVAEVIAMSSWRPEAGLRQYLAENGNWRSVPIGSDIETRDVCQMIYRLRDASENAYSYSSMRGAADGLILGKVSGHIESRKRDAKLSTILRQYYSRGGFIEKVPDLGDIRATFCNREYLLTEWHNMIHEQVRLFILLASASYSKVEQSVTFAMDKYSEAKRLGVFQNINRDLKDYCGADLSLEKPENLPLESPLDVIAVLDGSTIEENFKREQLIIGNLAKRLHLSYTGSRMTIFTDQTASPPSVSVPGTIYLQTIVEDTYSPACAACYVTQFAQDSKNSISDEDVIIAVNQYLVAKRENETRQNGVNGKVVILFNFDEDLPVGRPSSQQIRLEKALRDLYLEHQDVYIFALGKNPEVLKKYAKNDATFVMNAFDATEDEIGKQLYEKVIAAPAQLQYNDCRDARSEKSAVFEDFVSPNGVQHWSMPAKYFYKSFNLKFSFESFYGDVKVCHSRSTNAPEMQKDNCQDLTAGAKSIEFKHSNPCQGFTQYSCAPFYFSIIGVNSTDGQDKDYCDDKMTENKCKTLDQIKFKVTHEGIRCNGSIGLIATPLSILFAYIFSHLLAKLF